MRAAEQDRPDVRKARESWKQHQISLDPAKLVFVDHEPGPEVADNPLMVVWTERLLLDALTHERSVQDFFADLLDELAAAAGESDTEERRS